MFIDLRNQVRDTGQQNAPLFSIQDRKKFMKERERVNYKLKIFNFFLKLLSILFPQKLFYLTEYLNYEKLKSDFSQLKNIRIINKALSDKNGFDFLYSDKSGSGLGTLFNRRLDHFNINFDNKEKINLIRLDTFLQNENKDIIIDYFKMDVEGSELKILEGMGIFIKKIKLIQFEFGGCNIDSRTFFQDFWYYFKKHNFDLFRITMTGPKKIKEYSESDEFFRTTNYIALNNNL